MFIKPKIGTKVPDPFMGDDLPAKGRTVEKNQYWLRRIKDGDVTIVKPETKKRGKQ